MKLKYLAVAAVAVALSQSRADPATALDLIVVTCPGYSGISIGAPSGWAAINPSKLIEMKTPPAATNFICVYGGDVADVRVSIVKGCPSGLKAKVVRTGTGVCE